MHSTHLAVLQQIAIELAFESGRLSHACVCMCRATNMNRSCFLIAVVLCFLSPPSFAPRASSGLQQAVGLAAADDVTVDHNDNLLEESDTGQPQQQTLQSVLSSAAQCFAASGNTYYNGVCLTAADAPTTPAPTHPSVPLGRMPRAATRRASKRARCSCARCAHPIRNHPSLIPLRVCVCAVPAYSAAST